MDDSRKCSNAHWCWWISRFSYLRLSAWGTAVKRWDDNRIVNAPTHTGGGSAAFLILGWVHGICASPGEQSTAATAPSLHGYRLPLLVVRYCGSAVRQPPLAFKSPFLGVSLLLVGWCMSALLSVVCKIDLGSWAVVRTYYSVVLMRCPCVGIIRGCTRGGVVGGGGDRVKLCWDCGRSRSWELQVCVCRHVYNINIDKTALSLYSWHIQIPHRLLLSYPRQRDTCYVVADYDVLTRHLLRLLVLGWQTKKPSEKQEKTTIRNL